MACPGRSQGGCHGWGNPIHPWHPPWLRPGQAITYHRNGQRQLGTLELTDSFRWCFAQQDTTGRRVTEIELPSFAHSWKDFLDDEIIHIGHTPSPWIPSTTAGVSSKTKHVPTLAEPVQRGTLRSGRHFRGHARHVSAKGLTRPTPQFLWQSMRMPKDSPDYKIWLESYKEEHDALQEQHTYDEIDETELTRLKTCLLYTSPSPRDGLLSRMPSSA